MTRIYLELSTNDGVNRLEWHVFHARPAPCEAFQGFVHVLAQGSVPVG